MTREEDVYIQTLNLLGTDVEPPEIQQCLDAEHALADPVWGQEHKAKQELIA